MCVCPNTLYACEACDHPEEDKDMGATMSALTVYFFPLGREWRGVEGGDDKAAEMMGCTCPSPTSEDEQLRPEAVDKETCSAKDHHGISWFILHLSWITVGALMIPLIWTQNPCLSKDLYTETSWSFISTGRNKNITYLLWQLLNICKWEYDYICVSDMSVKPFFRKS